MTKWLVLLTLLLIAQLSSSAPQVIPSAPETREVVVRIIVTHDEDRDGQLETVGIGKRVTIFQGDTFVRQGLTNQNGSVSFLLEPGWYTVYAVVPITRIFFLWKCEKTFRLTEGDRLILLNCEERFFILWLF